MSKSFICEKCQKTFSTKGNLNLHIKSVCNENGTEHVCSFCQIDFKRKSSLISHQGVCQKKIEYEFNLKYSKLHEEYLKLQEKYSKLQEDSNVKYSKLQEEFDRYRENTRQVIENFKDELIIKDKNIEYLKGQKKIYESIKQDYNKQKQHQEQTNQYSINFNNTVNNNGTINMYMKNLQPITDELISEAGRTITMTDIQKGIPEIMKKFIPILKDKVICTDLTRNSLLYNYNGKIKRDSNGIMLSDKILTSTEPQYNMYKSELDTYYASLDNVVMSDSDKQRTDTEFENYKQYVLAIKATAEFKKKKARKRIASIIISNIKTKSQFESNIAKNILQSRSDEELPREEKLSDMNTSRSISIQEVHGNTLTSEPSSSTLTVKQIENKISTLGAKKTDSRFSKVQYTRQTLINNRIFEQHFDAQGILVRQIRLRSSGLPYLTDEETDPSSREVSGFEESSDDKE